MTLSLFSTREERKAKVMQEFGQMRSIIHSVITHACQQESPKVRKLQPEEARETLEQLLLENIDAQLCEISKHLPNIAVFYVEIEECSDSLAFELNVWVVLLNGVVVNNERTLVSVLS